MPGAIRRGGVPTLAARLGSLLHALLARNGCYRRLAGYLERSPRTYCIVRSTIASAATAPG
jgi:hypothetical protein